MRIRKNAKLWSSQQLTSSDVPGEELLLQPHICQLNQSPWDVISLSPRSLYSQYSLPLHPKFEEESKFTGAWNDCKGSTFELPSIPVDAHDEKTSGTFADDADSDDYRNGHGDESSMKLKSMMKKKKKKKKQGGGGLLTKPSCQNNNGRAWRGKKEPLIDGDGMSDYQLLKCSSSATDINKNIGISGKGSSRRPRAAKKSGSSNPYEFYYYSGFGPSWGKRRGESSGKEDGQDGNFSIVSDNSTSPVANTTPDSATPSPIETTTGLLDLDLMSDDDYTLDMAEEEEGGGRKRRMRKLVKARSLKSLM